MVGLLDYSHLFVTALDEIHLKGDLMVCLKQSGPRLKGCLVCLVVFWGGMGM